MKKLIAVLLTAAMLIPCFVTASASGNAQPLPEFSIGDYFIFGKYNGEPILWRYILNSTSENYGVEGTLLLSDKILCFKAFNTNMAKRPRGTNLWEESTLRAWLNSEDDGTQDCEAGFLSGVNFTPRELKAIKRVNQPFVMPRWQADALGYDWDMIYSHQHYQGRPHGDTSATTFYVSQMGSHVVLTIGASYELDDRMFLLNELQAYEVYKNFKTAAAGLAKPIQEYGTEGYNDAYWLTTPYNSNPRKGTDYSRDAYIYENACTISGEPSDNPHRDPRGNMDPIEKPIYGEVGDCYSNHPVTEEHGVRPAFYLDMDNAAVLSGSGTLEDPYVLNSREEINAFCNELRINFSTFPFIENDRTLVPFGPLFEAMGARSEWNQDTRTVSASLNGILLHLTADNTTAYVNGEEVYTDVPARVINGKPFVPLRFAAESLGFGVQWNEYEQRVDINR